MAKRRKPRLTLPKNKTSASQPIPKHGDPAGPTTKEWEEMKSYRSFVVKDQDDQPHTFTMNYYAIILPEGLQPDDPLDHHEYWVGKIKDIRSRDDDPSEVWVKVQWLWSAQEVSEQKKALSVQVLTDVHDYKNHGKMERFLSNMYDYVHSSCFQGLVEVLEYAESNIKQATIGDETFYYRYRYDHESREITPKPVATCFCGVIYNPDTSSIMHHCPRNKCCKSYHVSCLRKANWVEQNQNLKSTRNKAVYATPGVAPRELQLERTLPSSSVRASQKPVNLDVVGVPSTDAPAPQPPSHKRGRGRPRKASKSANQSEEGIEFDNHKLIPEPLLALARSPMVKGAGTNLPRDTGSVVGNVPFVARAREIVASVVQNRETLPEDWERLLCLPGEGAGSRLEAWFAQDEGFVCPSCGGAV